MARHRMKLADVVCLLYQFPISICPLFSSCCCSSVNEIPVTAVEMVEKGWGETIYWEQILNYVSLLVFLGLLMLSEHPVIGPKVRNIQKVLSHCKWTMASLNLILVNGTIHQNISRFIPSNVSVRAALITVELLSMHNCKFHRFVQVLSGNTLYFHSQSSWIKIPYRYISLWHAPGFLTVLILPWGRVKQGGTWCSAALTEAAFQRRWTHTKKGG